MMKQHRLMMEDYSGGKLSLEDMREIWNDEGDTYSDKQLLELREFVYVLHRIIMNAYWRKKFSEREC